MRKYKLKDIDVFLDKGDITEYDSDILINWLYIGLTDGPYPFKQIKEKAGDQFFYSILPLNQYINYTDSFTTIPGFLKTNIVVSCVLPVTKEMYNDCFFKLQKTINTYAKNNVCRYIGITIPEIKYCKYIIHYFKIYFSLLPSSVREIKIFVQNKNEYDILDFELSNVLDKKNPRTWMLSLKKVFSLSHSKK